MSGGRHLVLLIACALVLFAGASPQARGQELGPADATVYAPAFADVPRDHLFAGPIRALFAARITRGCNDTLTRFCPDDPVTRGQMAAFLTRSLDLPDGEPVDFTDVDGNTFETDIERLAAAGITKGCNPPDNDRFCPEDPITRGQMAAFIDRAINLPQADSVDFTDDDGSNFEDAIERLGTAGITKGCNPPDNDRFCPEDPITRGQMAAFLTRAFPDVAVPPEIPAGVTLKRAEAGGGGIGTELTVCRETEMSLMVRSVLAGADGTGVPTGWEPSTNVVPVGQFDATTDRWYLPPGTGCETLALAWDPRSNELTPPLSSLEITSHFGYRRHPITGVWKLHEGTDFAAAHGTSVFAAAAGRVVAAGSDGDLGRMVEIAHPGGLSTRYAHLSTIRVEAGQQLNAGDVVGLAGCTGSCTGPHLHFGTREFDVAVDPMSYLR